MWKPIPGTNGVYETSDRGQVRSMPRQTARGMRQGRVLKPGISSNGYPTVNVFFADGTRKNRPVHDWVLLTFAGERPPGAVCRHLNGDKTDNRWPENLVWGTSGENNHDTVRHGRHYNAEKTRCDKGHDLAVVSWGDRRHCPECVRESARKWAREKGHPKIAAQLRESKADRMCEQCGRDCPGDKTF